MESKTRLSIALLSLILLISFPGFLLPSASAGAIKVEVIIGFLGRPDVDLVKQNGGEVHYIYSIITAVYASLPEKAVEALKKNPRIAYIHENGRVEALEETIPWGIERIKATQVWSESTGSGVKIAILDTGVGPHDDLSICGGYDFVNNDKDPSDDNGHGTHVAGTIAALDNDFGVVGVAPGSLIYAVKMLDSSGSGTIAWAVQAIEWSVNNGMQVLSMSWGASTDYQALRDACKAAYDKGLLLVAAAGNSGNSQGTGDNVAYPAKYDSVIAVAATDQNNNRASWSSTGPAVELAAPGVNIYSTYKNNGYATLSGTSMATPHVSGTAALVWAKNPTLTNVEVRKILRDTATDLGATGRDSLYGYGLVNAFAAVSAAPSQKPIAVTIVNPPDGSTVKGNVRIQASVKNTEASLSSVQYAIDETNFNGMEYNASSGYWEADWDTTTVADGSHKITVKATDEAGNSDEKTITVTVANAVKTLTVSVSTDKTTYRRGGYVYITVKVADNFGSPVGGATVVVTVYYPSGLLAGIGSGTTGSNGVVVFRYKIPSLAPRGTYTVLATASKIGYETGTGETTFKVS
ncbi:MAG: S8 family serine peptidase [Candidatus Bathyarchaeia archaeon]